MNQQQIFDDTTTAGFEDAIVNMKGETDPAVLLAAMRPILHDEVYVFCSVDQKTCAGISIIPLGIFQEQEGATIIATRQQAEACGLPTDTAWAHIELTVHSSLSAVGLIAAVSSRLARAGISVNVVSAYYHDHLFVPWESRWEALDILLELSRSG